MGLSQQLDQLSKAPPKHKVLGLVLVSAFFGAIFYLVFYSDTADQLSRLSNQAARLQQEVASYEDKKQKYMAFRAEVNKLLEDQKELLKVLPSEAEIPTFLQSIHAQGELSGLNILKFKPSGEQKKKFYAKIPVQMSISGTFHQILKFFYSVGRLKRIVNIQNLALGESKETDKGVMLKAGFLASTFRFIAPKTKQAPGRGQPSHGGG